MPRVLLNDEIAGMSAWAWTVIWLAAGVFLGVIATLLLERRCKRSPSAPHAHSPTPLRAVVHGDSTHEITKFDSLSTRLAGNSNGSISSNATSSGNRGDGSTPGAHWNPPVGLPTVAEHPGTSASLGSTISVAQQSTGSVALPQPPASAEQLTTSISAGLRASGNSGAAGPLERIQQSAQHNRSMSTVSGVSSVGPSAEYDEDDLDEEWLRLIDEVNALLSTKRKEPIRNARERATVVNSLLVSTTTRNRQDCIRNAAVDMLTFRKMHESPLP